MCVTLVCVSAGDLVDIGPSQVAATPLDDEQVEDLADKMADWVSYELLLKGPKRSLHLNLSVCLSVCLPAC